MSERYTQIGNKRALLLLVLVVSVWEMSEPTEGATGEFHSMLKHVRKAETLNTDKEHFLKRF